MRTIKRYAEQDGDKQRTSKLDTKVKYLKKWTFSNFYLVWLFSYIQKALKSVFNFKTASTKFLPPHCPSYMHRTFSSIYILYCYCRTQMVVLKYACQRLLGKHAGWENLYAHLINNFIFSFDILLNLTKIMMTEVKKNTLYSLIK